MVESALVTSKTPMNEETTANILVLVRLSTFSKHPRPSVKKPGSSLALHPRIRKDEAAHHWYY